MSLTLFGIGGGLMKLSSTGAVQPAASNNLYVPGSLTVVTGNATAPALAFGDGDSGFYENSDDSLGFSTAGNQRFTLTGSGLFSGTSGSWALNYTNNGSTAPSFNFSNDTDTGVGHAALDQLSLIAGGVEMMRLTEDTLNFITVGAILDRKVTAGLTASTTQAQGQLPLTAEVNVFSTVANANDAATMPTAVAGRCITVVNNGANTLQLFPAASDQFSGAAVNASTTIAAGAYKRFLALSATVWLEIT